MPRPTVLEELHRDHTRLALILTALEAWAHDKRKSDSAQLDRVDAMVEYISEYPDAVHHPLEDRVFERLLGKKLTKGERAAVIKNADQHQDLARRTEQLSADLDAALDAEDGVTPELLAHAAEYARVQLDHMGFEEREVFPLAERKLEADDWQAIEAEERLTQDPLFDQQLSRFEDVYHFAVDDEKPLFSYLRRPVSRKRQPSPRVMLSMV